MDGQFYLYIRAISSGYHTIWSTVYTVHLHALNSIRLTALEQIKSELFYSYVLYAALC